MNSVYDHCAVDLVTRFAIKMGIIPVRKNARVLGKAQ